MVCMETVSFRGYFMRSNKTYYIVCLFYIGRGFNLKINNISKLSLYVYSISVKKNVLVFSLYKVYLF